MQQASRRKISTHKARRIKIARKKFHEKISFTRRKINLQVSRREKQGATEQKSAHDKFHEQKSTCDKFDVQNQFHEEKNQCNQFQEKKN